MQHGPSSEKRRGREVMTKHRADCRGLGRRSPRIEVRQQGVGPDQILPTVPRATAIRIVRRGWRTEHLEHLPRMCFAVARRMQDDNDTDDHAS